MESVIPLLFITYTGRNESVVLLRHWIHDSRMWILLDGTVLSSGIQECPWNHGLSSLVADTKKGLRFTRLKLKL